MSLTQRTIRITIAVVLSIVVAMAIGLENALAAGIIAILGVMETRLETAQNAVKMFLSTVLAFIIASGIFAMFGYSVFSFGLYMAIYVLLAYTFNVSGGIAPSSVMVTHFMIAESISWQWQINGLLIMGIGLVFAMLMNLWNPSHNEKLELRIEAIEKQMSFILFLLEKRLTNRNETVDRIQSELKDLCRQIDALQDLALVEHENKQFTRSEHGYYIRYAQMRQQQYEILKIITESLTHIGDGTKANNILASIFGETAEQLDESNTGIELLNHLSDLYRVFRDSELPQSREEFESRAILYNILTDFERFLELKRDFYIGDQEDQKTVE